MTKRRRCESGKIEGSLTLVVEGLTIFPQKANMANINYEDDDDDDVNFSGG